MVNPYDQRFRTAAGGYPTYFATFLAGALAYTFGNVTWAEIIPTRAFFSRAGFLKYAARPGLQFVLPVIVGHAAGVAFFGDVREIHKLTHNSSRYRHEMNEYKKELLYN